LSNSTRKGLPKGWTWLHTKPPSFNQKNKNWWKNTSNHKKRSTAEIKRKQEYKKGYYTKIIPEKKSFKVYRTKYRRANY
jgi:hypothetical protein